MPDHRLHLIAFVLATGGCAAVKVAAPDTEPGDSTPVESTEETATDTVADSAGDSGGPEETAAETGVRLTLEASVADNPANPFSALVTVTASEAGSVAVRYGEGTLDHLTLPVDVLADAPTVVPILGLRSSRSYLLEASVDAGDARTESAELTYTTAPLPDGFTTCVATFTAPEAEFSRDEAVCTNLQGTDGHHAYTCMDRWGTPVFWIKTADDDSLWSTAPLLDGGWAATGWVSSTIGWFNSDSRETERLTAPWFEGRTRFVHQIIDPHELVELRSGPWAGAVLFVTASTEVLADGRNIVGNGLIAYDQASDTILWDYSFLGDLDDGVAYDSHVPFDRVGLGDKPEDWTHVNTVLYGFDGDGRMFLLVALKAQDWIVKLYPDTDEIAWVLGRQGDFTLVDDLDAATPSPLPDPDWMYHAHGMAWLPGDGTRLRFTLFDNGYPRHDGEVIDWESRYSRVLEVDVDEEARLVSTPVVVGAPDADADDWFFSASGGNAFVLPDGRSAIFLSGEQQVVHEVSWPDGAERWRLECGFTGENMYRVRWTAGL